MSDSTGTRNNNIVGYIWLQAAETAIFWGYFRKHRLNKQ